MLSLAGLNQQKRVLTKITLAILLSSLVFTSILTIFLSFNLTSPLKKLIENVNRISTDIFNRNYDIEGKDEMGILGIKINEMAENIEELMNKIVEEEQEKRELELKALQNQINPHFLYNTLNTKDDLFTEDYQYNVYKNEYYTLLEENNYRLSDEIRKFQGNLL